MNCNIYLAALFVTFAELVPWLAVLFITRLKCHPRRMLFHRELLYEPNDQFRDFFVGAHHRDFIVIFTHLLLKSRVSPGFYDWRGTTRALMGTLKQKQGDHCGENILGIISSDLDSPVRARGQTCEL